MGNESTNFLLQVAGLTGVGSLTNNVEFSTHDNDNDWRAPVNCAFKSGAKGGGFWYSACGNFFPNGEYKVQGMGYQKYLFWNNFRGYDESLKDTIMLIRKTDP